MRAPLNNTLLRRAIVEAVNVSAIQQLAFGGYAISFVGPMPSGLPNYNSSLKAPQYNVTDAKKLLTQAGYPNGNGLPTLTYVYAQSPYSNLIAQILTQDLGQVGINVKPEGVTINTYFSMAFAPSNFTSSSAPDMIENPWSWWPDFTGYEYIVDDSSGFFLWFHNQTINDLIGKSNYEINPQLRAQEISQVALMVQQQAGFIWTGQFIDMFNPGTFTGLPVFNKCNTAGLWFSQSYFGVPYSSLSFTCSPT
jgi:ABC-type transport system substrate-binding protein